ncbi:YhcH/YjgK/YiaL family protein [Cellulosilyticum sp. I15G10I2]|uniref:YhcH/YjgK/YiaL family protein n=1 Tax=Cellulosilyticum sp. I15G10I2 TaxID=1892843 RepID=UPI00085C38DA|nr:YhcH/YjgK/YiaL family protein [Cellulosilyticum sp. I15G10I2]
MIVDHISNLKKYNELGLWGEKIIEFIAYFQKAKLRDGRYDILGDNLFALVQSYMTIPSDEGRWESHQEYVDLQYIVQGAEMMYWALTDTLAVSEDHTPEKDILFYHKGPHKAALILERDMFALLLTHDAHMPCCETLHKQKVKKIVFKIKSTILKRGLEE